MSKIIFVCYNQGAGGEKLSKEISKLDCVYELPSKMVGERTITKDLFKGFARNNVFNKTHLQNIIDKEKFRQAFANPHVNKWCVVPTHFSPIQLEPLNCTKFYVVIYVQLNESKKHLKQNAKTKVWQHIFEDPLELKGQIEADSADPYDSYITSRLKGHVQYGKLWSIMQHIDPISDDLEVEYEMWAQKIQYMEYTNMQNCFNIEYMETRSPNFYQQFSKKIHKQLTKY